jgi:hypothetical protein
VACLPAWFRLAQCLRLYYDTLVPFPHLCNAGKYASTITVVIASSLYAYFGSKKALYKFTKLSFISYFSLIIFTLIKTAIAL